jgi:hypothetical protein
MGRRRRGAWRSSSGQCRRTRCGLRALRRAGSELRRLRAGRSRSRGADRGADRARGCAALSAWEQPSAAGGSPPHGVDPGCGLVGRDGGRGPGLGLEHRVAGDRGRARAGGPAVGRVWNGHWGRCADRARVGAAAAARLGALGRGGGVLAGRGRRAFGVLATASVALEPGVAGQAGAGTSPAELIPPVVALVVSVAVVVLVLSPATARDFRRIGQPPRGDGDRRQGTDA